MTEDDYTQSHVDIIKTLVESTATDDELTDNDIISIINAGIIAMKRKTNDIKLAYPLSKRER